MVWNANEVLLIEQIKISLTTKAIVINLYKSHESIRNKNKDNNHKKNPT